jgi:hypothetical protein
MRATMPGDDGQCEQEHQTNGPGEKPGIHLAIDEVDDQVDHKGNGEGDGEGAKRRVGALPQENAEQHQGEENDRHPTQGGLPFSGEQSIPGLRRKPARHHSGRRSQDHRNDKKQYAGEGSHSNLGIDEARPDKTRLREIRSAHVGTAEIGAVELGSAERSPAKIPASIVGLRGHRSSIVIDFTPGPGRRHRVADGVVDAVFADLVGDAGER